jgi:hypothetical protein
MKTILRVASVLLGLSTVLFFTPGCGEDGNGGGCDVNPAGPGCVQLATITPSTDMVYIGQRVTFSATPTTGVTWGGDNPAVATVDASTGVVTGIATGKVTIWAQNSAGRTTRLLSVLPSYNGKWSGSYALIGCQSTGDFTAIDFCGMFFQGEVLNMGFDLTQSRDQVTGSFSLGDLLGTLSASTVNGTDGSLPLTGSSTTADGLVIQMQNLRATSPSPGTMKGSFDQVWGLPGATGTGRLACEIRDVTRTSGAPTVRFLSPGANAPALTLEQAVRAVRRR